MSSIKKRLFNKAEVDCIPLCYLEEFSDEEEGELLDLEEKYTLNLID